MPRLKGESENLANRLSADHPFGQIFQVFIITRVQLLPGKQATGDRITELFLSQQTLAAYANQIATLGVRVSVETEPCPLCEGIPGSPLHIPMPSNLHPHSAGSSHLPVPAAIRCYGTLARVSNPTPLFYTLRMAARLDRSFLLAVPTLRSAPDREESVHRTWCLPGAPI